MAHALTARLHGDEAAAAAEEHFDRLHVRRELPDEIPELWLRFDGDTIHVPAALSQAFGISSSEGRRLIAQGGVRLDGEPLGEQDLDVPAGRLEGAVLQAGKRRFARIKIS
jgi:tyrosyl-tRNA synthetase